MISLDTGAHTISVTGEGLEPDVREVTLVAGSTDTLRFDPQPKMKLGGFRIRTAITSGEVLVDGSNVAAIPMTEPVELQPGKYQIAISQEGVAVWTGSVTVETGKIIEVSATNPERGKVGIMTISAIALSGAGLVSVGAGVLFGLSASDAESSLESQLKSGKRPEPALIDSGEQDALFANIFYGVGLVAIGTGVALYLLDDGGSEAAQAPGETAVSVDAIPMAGGGAVRLGFGF
jgi:hypothetical protein